MLWTLYVNKEVNTKMARHTILSNITHTTRFDCLNDVLLDTIDIYENLPDDDPSTEKAIEFASCV